MNKKALKKILKKGCHNYTYDAVVLTNDVAFKVVEGTGEVVLEFFLSDLLNKKIEAIYYVGRN